MIDSHTHLFERRFQGEEPVLSPADLLRGAGEAGLTDVVTVAITPSAWQEALDLAAAQRTGRGPVAPRVWVAAGLHPCHVHEEPLTPAQLCAVAGHPQVVALGETGLDRHHDSSESAFVQQQSVFRAHLTAAEATGLPLVIHTRDAEQATLDMLAEHPGVSFVLHCFTGSRAMAEQAIAMGGYISFSGVLSFKKSHNLREIAASLPVNRILIETDAPYLAPEPHRGRRNQPALLPHTAAALAAARSQSLAEIIHQTRENTHNFYPKMVAAA